MGNGYVGQIIRINLTNRSISYINTSKYEKWGGGHGMGSAIFFDIAIVEKGLDLSAMGHNSPTDGGFHPDNVVTIMTSPFNGTIVPGASGRTEVQGIGVQSYPIGWFTRSNFGGRFGSMLKYAGYDGIVIEGAADTPVWVDIRDENITIRECSALDLWGQDTKTCQETIWDNVAGDDEYGEWITPGNANGQTTQRPAVLTIGPAGENKSRMACLIHDAGNASGQGGFGGVWGSKNLKAISVIGTGSIEVDDPAGLVQARIEQMENYGYDKDNPVLSAAIKTRFHSAPSPVEVYKDNPLIARSDERRPQGCTGCPAGCKARYKSGKGNEVSCMTTQFYKQANTSEIQYEALDLVNRYGFNSMDLGPGLIYLNGLYTKGVLGSGREIETDLDFEGYGSLEFINSFLDAIATMDSEFTNAVRNGFRRAIAAWGRETDIADIYELDGMAKTDVPGKIQLPYWGLPEHSYDPRCELEWGYGSILGDRDINEHAFNSLHYDGLNDAYSAFLGEPEATADEAVSIFVEKMVPHKDDYYTSMEERKEMLNFSDENMYSDHMARLVSWHRHYSRFYKQSLLFCDFRWPDFVNLCRDDKVGSTGEAEPRFIKVVTGNDMTFLQGMETGKKIWNLDNAIWVLQGRHRDNVHFADYIYESPFSGNFAGASYHMPTNESSPPAGESNWEHRDLGGRQLEKGSYTSGDDPLDNFEGFKTRFYILEGWDPDTGWPTRDTLEALELKKVADVLYPPSP